ncbi:phage head closure protein [Hymenobacter sp. HMF4947]|uniref:Phage head closure protein n=1 Tax=Hymenobacter ginkgonis TaxID=2682976 RepID=A0A7K1TKI1_9BACT|nr:phage head closure protein [Hymenobacter ginkgonis]MVN78924.1 phage head closure protein [Hymenobacter ginkgonis]
MNFGKCDRLITLQIPTPAPANEYGGPGQQQQYADVAQVWAQVKPLPGAEGFIGDQLTATQRQEFTIRYRPDVQPTWQLVFEGTTYQLISVSEFGRRVGLILTAYARG